MNFVRALIALPVLIFTLSSHAVGLDRTTAPDPALAKLITQARNLNLDYLIESAVMNVRLDTATNTSTPKTTDVEITYTILALRTVTNFDEEYHAMTPEAQVTRIHGTLPESELDHPTSGLKKWSIPLHLSPGQRQTFVTAARYQYPHGLPAHRTIRDFPDLTPAEDAYCYPNTEDLIAHLTIRIQSPRPGDALLAPINKNSPDKKIPTTPTLNPPDAPDPTPYIITARWTNITPNQNCELKIRH